MIAVGHAAERGQVRLGWLNNCHSFSFGDYHDPRHMGIANLRVINDDTVAPGGGFAAHGHRDMEIISYVLSGQLEHRDSMGNGSVIRPGDVQRMSAGTGVMHREYNPSSEEPVHFLQIWLRPNRRGVDPAYSQKHYPVEERRGWLRLLVSPDGRNGSIGTHQDTLVYGTLIERGESVEHGLEPGWIGHVHVARGEVTVNGETLAGGDSARIESEKEVRIGGLDSAEVLLFDLP